MHVEPPYGKPVEPAGDLPIREAHALISRLTIGLSLTLILASVAIPHWKQNETPPALRLRVPEIDIRRRRQHGAGSRLLASIPLDDLDAQERRTYAELRDALERLQAKGALDFADDEAI